MKIRAMMNNANMATPPTTPPATGPASDVFPSSLLLAAVEVGRDDGDAVDVTVTAPEKRVLSYL
jgi:hypothetical protein